jgi:hypothetical protein
MTPHPKNVEKSRFCDQNFSGRLEKIKSQILARQAVLAEKGNIVTTWRKHGDSISGPYFSLKYYDSGVQRSIYIGRSAELAEKVRLLLSKLQSHRTCRRLHKKIRASLRLQKARLKIDLQTHGYNLKGYEFHKTKSQNSPEGTEILPAQGNALWI